MSSGRPPKVKARVPEVAATQDAAAQSLLEHGTEDHYLDTALYDFEYADQRGDIEWYLAAVEDHRQGRDKVLELGAGTGRIALPLAQAGHSIVALDRMPSMLEALQAKLDKPGELDPPVPASRVKCIEADMTEIPLGKASVGMVIAPFNALMHLYTWADLLTCFHEVWRVLKPGGVFAFDVLMPDLEWLTWDPKVRHGVTPFRHPVTGASMCYSTNHDYDHETQVCHIRLYYDLGTRPRPRKTPYRLVHLAHRQIWPEELRALLATAGFMLESHDGDFLGLRLKAEVESQVLVARKPARR